MKPSCKYLIPPVRLTNLYRCSILCNVKDGRPGDCLILLGKEKYCRFQEHIVKKPTKPSCRYLCPPNQMIKQWYCHMGPERTGDCHIFQGKAKVCDFQWPWEERMETKNKEEWIVIDEEGNAKRYFSKEAMMATVREDIGEIELGSSKVIHVSIIKEYTAEVVDPIKLTLKKGR